MTAWGPIMLVAGLLLIGFGLVYPVVALFRTNRHLADGNLAGRYLVATVALYGLLPLSAVLAGFFLLSARARTSPVFLGALIGSAVLLLIVLIIRQRVQRN